MKERPILIVAPCIVDFLIPYYSSTGRGDIYHLQPVCISHQIIRKHRGPLQASVGPFASIGIRNIESGNGHSLDLVRSLWNLPLDHLLVIFSQY